MFRDIGTLNFSMIREYRLSPAKSSRGVSCDAGGAHIGHVPLLKRSGINSSERWAPRECEQLSKDVSAQFGLPIDMSPKMGGIRAIANALNEGDLARAQIAAVLLRIPELPVLSKGERSRGHLIDFIHDLHGSGMIKADWDSDEHPRWPAGAPDSQGGEFAPKGDDTNVGQTDGDAGVPRPSREMPPDAGISARQRFYGGDVPSNIEPALQNDNASILSSTLDGGSRPEGDVSDTEDRGIYADYGGHIGDTQLAATAIPMGGLGITSANPANWENVTRLANGSLELGSGQIITAAELLAAWDRQRQRAAVDAAISKFGFDSSNAADVLAAHAYVWTQHFAPALALAPGNFPDVPWSGPQLEAVSQSIMALELARPGTLYLYLQGDKPSGNYLRVAAEVGMRNGAIFESRPRPANLPAALQTSISRARATLKLRPNDQMQAHHLVPANVWGTDLEVTLPASKAGWQPDEATNLIALPANAATQAELALKGTVLPIHSASHPIYDVITHGLIIIQLEKYDGPLTPTEARKIYEVVAEYNKLLIYSGVWIPRLR